MSLDSSDAAPEAAPEDGVTGQRSNGVRPCLWIQGEELGSDVVYYSKI